LACLALRINEKAEIRGPEGMPDSAFSTKVGNWRTATRAVGASALGRVRWPTTSPSWFPYRPTCGQCVCALGLFPRSGPLAGGADTSPCGSPRCPIAAPHLAAYSFARSASVARASLSWFATSSEHGRTSSSRATYSTSCGRRFFDAGTSSKSPPASLTGSPIVQTRV